MGISSLGAGSSILTQDVIDQLKAADEAKFVAPVDARLSDENSKVDAFKVLDAYMDNVYESLKGLTEYGVFESRTATSSDSEAVEVSALESSDIQDFTLEVSTLATKEIVQSGSFLSRESNVATGGGTMELSVGSETFSIVYDDEMSLEDLKEQINKEAGDSANATIVQVADGDFRLLLSAVNTGSGQSISIADEAGGTLSEALVADTDTTDGMTNVQTAVDASFKFNGVDITRSSNTVDDLLSGVTLTLKEAEVGKIINVSVQQDRESIESKITNFVDKYNSALYQLNEDTKSSQDEEERGVFSSDSTIKAMKSSLVSILSTVGEGAARIQDYGLEVDEDGRLSLDTAKLNEKLEDDPTSTQSFFAGGTFTDENGSTVELTGVFVELEDEFAKYSKYNTILDQYKESMDTRISSLEEQRVKAVERLDSSYAIMAKRFAAYDLIINQFNAASDMFSQMINAEIAAKG